MPKITDGQFALGGLALFAIWVFVVLPFLYQVPITQKCYGNQPNSTAPYSGGPGDHISAPVATTEQTIPKPNAAAHPSNESEKYSNEFWSAKLTDWLLAAFTLALVFFTGRLYYATAGLFTETAGLREAAAEQSIHMKASIAVAQRAAEAAELSAKAAIGVELPIISITDFALMESSTIRITGGVPPEIAELGLPFKNSGRTVASLIEQCVETIVVDTLPTIPVYEHIFPFVPGTLVEADKPSPVNIRNYFIRLTTDERDAIKDEKKSLWLYGYISFEDRLGERHQSRFCARWVVYKSLGNTPTGFVYDSRTPPDYTRRT
jgi:hypothetical protein